MLQTLLYLLYGAVAGFSQFVPVSASAHRAFFSMIFRLDSGDALLQLFVHAGALAAAALLYRQRATHLYTQLRLASLPAKRRKRPADASAVQTARMLMTAAIPTLLGAFLSTLIASIAVNLPAMSILLIACAAALYLPDYLPGGDRGVRQIYPVEALIFGIAAGLSSFAGMSCVAWIVAIGLLRKCDREFVTETAMLIVGILLAGMVAADFVTFLITGLSGLSFLHILRCFLAAAAAFAGAFGAILTMRHLSVHIGFSAFAYYNCGLGIFSFILYLML